MAPQLLSSCNFKSLFDSVETFLFECNGTLFSPYFSFDSDPQGKNVVFVTNNSVKSRRQYAEKFQSFGVPSVTQEDGEKRAQWKSNSLFEHDKSVGAVVV
ncbi:unnamed protein product [Thlaspi arvense]|uniref:Phosphoglycolate phosphatase n=1 Tax=Thlaspi arvense TaxID=13288 RepID=A0AAU9RRF9_THLAR|nr:unnamed protein product [Thlaspi arvense]